jgi:hypothetical protein
VIKLDKDGIDDILTPADVLAVHAVCENNFCLLYGHA